MSMDQSNSINCVKGCDLRLRARARARSVTERARIARARRPRPLSLSSEIHNMLTVMRLNARWASGARFRREIPLQAESPLTRGLKALHDHLQGFCDIRDVDTVRYLAPFVAVVRSARASGPLTGAALSSLHKFLLYGFLSRHATRAREAVDLVGAGIAGCVFEETDSESDEVTLMKLLELSALSLRCDAGILLSDLRIWEMFQVGRRARPPPSPLRSLPSSTPPRGRCAIESRAKSARPGCCARRPTTRSRTSCCSSSRACTIGCRAARRERRARRRPRCRAPRARTTRSGETTSTARARAARRPARAIPSPARRRRPRPARRWARRRSGPPAGRTRSRSSST